MWAVIYMFADRLIGYTGNCNVFAKTDDGKPEHSNTTF